MLSDSTKHFDSLYNRSSLKFNTVTKPGFITAFDRYDWHELLTQMAGSSRSTPVRSRFSASDARSAKSAVSNVSQSPPIPDKAIASHRSVSASQHHSDSRWAALVRPLRVVQSVDPGTASVHVDDRQHKSKHSIFSQAITTTAAGDGHTLATAHPLDGSSGVQTINDFVGSSATDNYYRFTLATTSDLSLSLSNLSADADLQLIRDANGNGVVDPNEVIASSARPRTEAEAIATGLVPGTYYVHVYQYSGDTTYTLSLSTTPLALPAHYDPSYGYGLVNASNAIAGAIGQNPSSPVATASSSSNAWDLNLVNAPAAWAQGYTGQGVVVAVVDTGVDSTHPDLKDNIWTNPGEIPGNGIDDDHNGFVDDVHGWDFVDRDNTPTDTVGHGTHVAGTIAAEQNGFGVTGVAYNAKIMPVRVIGPDSGSSADVAAGIRYAADNGANVINLSLGGSQSTAIADAVQYATAKGALVVMAAGNDGGISPTFPGNLANRWGIAVGAVDINRTLATFSDRAGAAPLNYVVAPGVDILSTTPNNTYQTYSGTSMAAPHVSGVAALLLSANPKLTPAQLTNLLTADATL